MNSIFLINNFETQRITKNDLQCSNIHEVVSRLIRGVTGSIVELPDLSERVTGSLPDPYFGVTGSPVRKPHAVSPDCTDARYP